MRSGLEVKVAKYLESKGIDYKYETVTLLYKVPEKVHRYIPDFILPNGIIIEAKGNFTSKDRVKMAHVMEGNPALDIRMLFMRNNPISKTSKTKYSDWCEKRGIPYHVSAEGKIPDEWLLATQPNKEIKTCLKKKSPVRSPRAKSTKQQSSLSRSETKGK